MTMPKDNTHFAPFMQLQQLCVKLIVLYLCILFFRSYFVNNIRQKNWRIFTLC